VHALDPAFDKDLPAHRVRKADALNKLEHRHYNLETNADSFTHSSSKWLSRVEHLANEPASLSSCSRDLTTAATRPLAHRAIDVLWSISHCLGIVKHALDALGPSETLPS
jgi:hypothetical protein